MRGQGVLGRALWPRWAAATRARSSRRCTSSPARSSSVRPATSSMEGEAEYGFWHLLVRDVCYGQIPRAARAARHRAAAAWIERQAGERVEDLADVLAAPLPDGARARPRRRPERPDGGAGGRSRPLPRPGRRACARLDVDRAEQKLAQALALCPAGAGARVACSSAGRGPRSSRAACARPRAALEEALALHRERGEPVGAARALTRSRNLAPAAGRSTLAGRDRRGARAARGCSRPAPSSSTPTPARGIAARRRRVPRGDRGRRAGARARRRARPARAAARAGRPRPGPRCSRGPSGAGGHA